MVKYISGGVHVFIWRCKMTRDMITPETITRADMKKLADHIEEYVMVLQEVMIIPEEIMHKEEEIKHAIKIVNKLIKKLRKGDKNVFKDADEWNSLS